MCLLMTITNKHKDDQEIVLEAQEVLLGGVPVAPSRKNRRHHHFIVDTGSNVTIVHVPNTNKYRGKRKTITFHNKNDPHHRAVDLNVRIKINGGFCLKGRASVLNLFRAIPSFPPTQSGIIGTNMFQGRMIKVCNSGSVCIVKRNARLDGFYELEGVVGCDKYSDQLELGPLLTVNVGNKNNKRLFLVDTGNLRSTFCVVKKGQTKKQKQKQNGKGGGGCIAQLRLKNKNETYQVFGDYLGWAPESLVSIKCSSGKSPVGNLGLDVWTGMFRESIFDFGSTLLDGRPVYRIFCRP